MKFIALALTLPLCASLNVAARRYVLAENASKFYTELDNRHENVTLHVVPFRRQRCRTWVVWAVRNDLTAAVRQIEPLHAGLVQV